MQYAGLTHPGLQTSQQRSNEGGDDCLTSFVQAAPTLPHSIEPSASAISQQGQLCLRTSLTHVCRRGTGERRFQVEFATPWDALVALRACLANSILPLARGLQAHLGPEPVPSLRAAHDMAPIKPGLAHAKLINGSSSPQSPLSVSSPATPDLMALRAAALSSRKRKREEDGEPEEGEISANVVSASTNVATTTESAPVAGPSTANGQQQQQSETPYDILSAWSVNTFLTRAQRASDVDTSAAI